MNHEQFRQYEIELVGEEEGAHARLAKLLGTSEISIKRYATKGREIPEYIARSLRAHTLLYRYNKLIFLQDLD